MRVVYVYALLILMLSPSVTMSQDQSVNVRDLHASRFSLVLGGVNWVGGAFDVFLSNRLNLELSAGMGIGAGLRYHPKGADPDVHWSPYIGGYYGILMIPDIFGSGGYTTSTIYIPVGIHYISMSGKFSIALEAGYQHYTDSDDRALDIPMGAIKIHWSIPSLSLW